MTPNRARNIGDTDTSSLFETAADFFSLFSLVSIVAVLVYSAATPIGGTTRVASTDPGTAFSAGIVSNTLYVVVAETGNMPRVEVRFQTSTRRTFEIQMTRGEARTSSIREVVSALGDLLEGREVDEIECLIEDPPSDELLGYYWELQNDLEQSGGSCTRLGKLR